ncbi:MAG: hypothetical protein IJZ48_00460 [Oscillospiraceae bacterium]|nr:hypothetical protein [Oscillospiraceae bacterium]
MKKIVCLLFVVLLIGTMLCACSSDTVVSHNTTEYVETKPATKIRTYTPLTKYEMEEIAADGALNDYFLMFGDSDWSKRNSWAEVNSLIYQETREYSGGYKEKRYKAYVTVYIYDNFDDFIYKRHVTYMVSDNPEDKTYGWGLEPVGRIEWGK